MHSISTSRRSSRSICFTCAIGFAYALLFSPAGPDGESKVFVGPSRGLRMTYIIIPRELEYPCTLENPDWALDGFRSDQWYHSTKR